MRTTGPRRLGRTAAMPGRRTFFRKRRRNSPPATIAPVLPALTRASTFFSASSCQQRLLAVTAILNLDRFQVLMAAPLALAGMGRSPLRNCHKCLPCLMLGQGSMPCPLVLEDAIVGRAGEPVKVSPLHRLAKPGDTE